MITLERGLIAGALLFALGLGASFSAVAYWESVRISPLDLEKTMRLVIPGIVCCTSGFQTILSSFFLSILGIVRRDAEE